MKIKNIIKELKIENSDIRDILLTIKNIYKNKEITWDNLIYEIKKVIANK